MADKFEYNQRVEVLGNLFDETLLRPSEKDSRIAHLSDSARFYLIQVAQAGPEGLKKGETKLLDKKYPEACIELYAQDYVLWEYDSRGNPYFLVVNWKGEELAKLLMTIAKYGSHQPTVKKPT